ncbi:MAG: hypothetical protein ABIP81_00400, partial [Terriglobales bacterium]
MTRDDDRFNPDRSASFPRSREPKGVVSIPEQGFDLDDEFPTDIVADLQAEEEPQFLRAQRRVSVRKGPVTRKTANRLRVVLVIAVILGTVGASSAGVYNYATHSWRFRVDSSDSIETQGLQNVTRAQVLEVMGGDIGRNIFRIPLEERRK